MILSDYFKYGFMGFLAPNVSPAHLTEYMKDIYRWCRNETVGIEPIAKVFPFLFCKKFVYFRK